jgi:hypothetical protein
MERHELLDNNPALWRSNWLPDGSEWPELAERRAQHERLLAAVEQARAQELAVHRRHSAAEKAHAAELQEAFLQGREPNAPDVASPDARAAEKADADRVTKAAVAALEQFLAEALAEIRERAPEWYAALDARAGEADAKRQEALRLLAEADAHVAGMERMRGWLRRATGESPMGQYPFSELPIPHNPETTRADEAQRAMEAYAH